VCWCSGDGNNAFCQAVLESNMQVRRLFDACARIDDCADKDGKDCSIGFRAFGVRLRVAPADQSQQAATRFES